MASEEHIAILRSGSESWNLWRAAAHVRPNLRDWNFEETHPHADPCDFGPDFRGFDFSGTDLHGISARNSIFDHCNFDRCALNFADLCFSHFLHCSFVNVSMRVTKLGSATFKSCNFKKSNLGYCSAEETSFEGSRIRNCSFEHMSLVKVDFTRASLRNVRVYGISAWDLNLKKTKQRDIVVGNRRTGAISVDNIELAQFIHLLIKNARIRDAIDTISSKVVLILGRFTPERKLVLKMLQRALQKKNYVPVVFDFAGPSSRDLTEAVRVLAHMARFVIADLTDPKSVPHELANIVPFLPSVPLHPIIAEGHRPFAMFEHYTRYPWVLPVLEYSALNLNSIADNIVAACEVQLSAK